MDNNTPKGDIVDPKEDLSTGTNDVLDDKNAAPEEGVEDNKVEENKEVDEKNKDDIIDDKKRGEKMFTQTEVNEIIKRRLEDRNNPLEDELEQLKNTVESMKAETEQIAHEKKLLKIKSILKDNQVREERVDSLIKLKGLDKAADDEIESLVIESIQEFPEFVNNENQGKGFRISTDPSQGSATMTLKEFNALSYKERMRIKKEQPHNFNKIMNNK